MQEVAQDQRIAVPRVLVAERKMANAFAVPLVNRVIFTTGLLKILDRDQVRGIAIHEATHLGGQKAALGLQAMSGLPMLLVFMGVRPIVVHFGLLWWMGLCAASFFLRARVARGQSKPEIDADTRVHESHLDDAVYATALERIQESNLVPAVIGTKVQSHPDLYDRLEAAGVTPDYPRPDQPLPQGGAGFSLFVFALLLLCIVFAARYLIGAGDVDNERAVAVTGGTGQLLEEPGRFRLEDEDLAAAEASLQISVELAPGRWRGFAYLAMTLAVQGRMGEGRIVLRRDEDLLTPEMRYDSLVKRLLDRARAVVE